MSEQILLNMYEYFKDPNLFGLDITGVAQILFIVFILVIFYLKFIKNTPSEKVVKGIFAFMICMWFLSEILKLVNLNILSTFLKGLIIAIILSFVVIFQPELRRFMGYLGQGTFFKKMNKKNDNEINVVKELLETVKHLKKTRTGALIVLEENDTTTAYTEVATKLDADVSTQLLLTIFHPNTPLHDGAVIINENKIVSAGVLLPLTEDPKLSWKYGTRHRAAIGMSEVADCACLVVSEETGEVSIAVDGTLKKYEDFTILKTDLENLLGYGSDDKIYRHNNIWDIFNKKNRLD